MALRILTQVNFSAGENPDGDSGMWFTAGLLKALVRLDKQFHFYVLVPERSINNWAAILSHPRITLLPISIEPRLHGGDFQFCPVRLAEVFDFRCFDVDVLFLNQPETAPAFLNFLNRQMFHNVPAVSYIHWFDTRRPSTPKQTLHHPALLGALTGMIVSAAVGCNSKYGKTQVLTQAAKWYNGELLTSFSHRIQILPPGIDVEEIESFRAKRRPGKLHRIIVNHRLLKYTGVRTLLTATFPKLWMQRKDFSVLVTNPSRVRLPRTITQAPWLAVESLSRSEYLRKLWQSDVVIAPHRACHWSISTLEAICAECVPLMNKESFFVELMAPLLADLSNNDRKQIDDRWYFYRSNLVARLSDLLDNLPRERRMVKRIADMARKIYDWNTIAQDWRTLFHDAETKIPVMAANTPSMCRIVELLKRENCVSKEAILRYLSWAPKQRTLSWTAFRKGLKLIADEDPNRPDAVFHLRKKPKKHS